MRKAKTAGEVAVMEVSQSSLGVRTRAKTLALQRLQKSPSSPSSAPPASAGSYLQLRSRRLMKPPIVVSSHGSKRQRQPPRDNYVQNPNDKAGLRLGFDKGDSESHRSVSLGRKEEICAESTGKEEEAQGNEFKDLGIEASFGENVLEFEGRDRSTRESTPCSLMRDPDSIRTPGSTTKPTSSLESNKRMHNSIHRHIPTAHEMDEFFAGVEEEQQRQFMEKYNFDPVNDKPLPGRFEWEKLDP